MRSSQRGTKAGVAALMSFTLIAAACGGNDDGTETADTDTTEADTGDAEEADAEEADAEEADAEEADAEEAEPVAGDGDGEAPEVNEEGQEAPSVEGSIPGGSPVMGGTLRYALEADVDGINPTSSALSSPGLMMGNVVFDTLVAATVDGTFVPYLAESLEPNDDFTSWTLTLREGVMFHDGTPLNAEAVVKNFETQRADPLVGLAVKPFFPEEGATEIVDSLTVVYNLADPNRYFPGSISGQLGMIASPTWIDAAFEDPTLNQAPVGTGPFAFGERSEDSITTFVRNDNWWNGDVYLDAVEFIPVTDPASRNDLLFEGEANGLQTSDPGSVGDLLDDDAIQSILDESGEESFAMINSTVAPFDDIRAREALALAAPIENYRNLIGLGVARAADSAFTPEQQFNNPDVVQAGDDPEAALALVAEYCAERGTEENTALTGPTCSDGRINMELQWSGPSVVQTRIAEILDEGWKAGGFNVTFQELPQDAHIQQAALGQYNVVTWRQFGATDPSTDNVWLLCRTIGGISLNWPKLCDEERDALLLQGQAIENGPERIAVYQEAGTLINEAFVYIFFVHTPWNNAFGDNVRGVCDRVAPSGEPLLCVTNGRHWFDTAYFEG
ncbi:MAG: peptide/nickel transport system substrate-binding protein [Candidatus Aldehydirespiratoraceae bacterium]|jgi:peptide/nickel transport system substrate-binding protein